MERMRERMKFHLIQGEIQVMLAVMRQNQRFSASSSDGLMLGFVELRNNLHKVRLSDSYETMKPFLELIRSVDAPAIITSLGLTSITKLVTYSFLSDVENDKQLSRSINESIDAICNCKFEALDASSEEIVLLKMQRLLLLILKCEGKELISRESKVLMIKTCYNISKQRRLSPLLRRTLENILVEMVRLIFSFENDDSWTEIFFFLLSDLPRNRHDKKSESVLMNISLCLSTLECAGHRMIENKEILSGVTSVFFPALILASNEEDNILFCVILRCVVTVIQSVGEVVPTHIYYLFESLYVPYLRNTYNPSASFRDKLYFERQELIIDSLLEIFLDSEMVVTLFANYDCNEKSSDIVSKLIELLSKNCLVTSDSDSFALRRNALECLEGFVYRLAEGAWVGDIPTEEVKVVQESRKRKQKLHLAVEAFNKEPIRGVEEFMNLGILPAQSSAVEVATTLLTAPGIEAKSLGTYFSDKAVFHLEVLREMCRLMTFGGKHLDEAMRMLLSRFRPAGDAQQIDKILDVFAVEYFAQNENGKLPDSDSVYTLSYALLLLNVDHHNEGVKVKMTKEQFVKNYSHISAKGGISIPEDELKGLYNSISAEEFVAYPSEQENLSSPLKWATILKSVESTSRLVHLEEGSPLLGDLLRVSWPSILYSLTKVYTNLSDKDIVTSVLDTLERACDLAVALNYNEILNRVVITLVAFIGVRGKINPISWEVEFSTSWKMQASAELLFKIVNKHYDRLSEAWRNISYVILFLAESLVVDVEFIQREDIFTEVAKHHKKKESSEVNSISSMFSAISSFLSVEYSHEDADPEVSQRQSNCKDIMARADIKGLLERSGDYKLDTLVYMMKAFVISSNTKASDSFRRICLDILCFLARRNVHRIDSFFMVIYDHIISLMKSDESVIERAIVTLFRIIIDILDYRRAQRTEDSQNNEVDRISSTKYLKIVVDMDDKVLKFVAPFVFTGIKYIHQNYDSVLEQDDWSILFSILKRGISLNVERGSIIETLLFVVSSSTIVPSVVQPLATGFVNLLKESSVEEGLKIVEALSILHFTINKQLAMKSGGGNSSAWPDYMIDDLESVLGLWTLSIRLLSRTFLDGREEMFNKSYTSLERSLLDPHNIDIPPEGVKMCFTKVLFPLLDETIKLQSKPGRRSSPAISGQDAEIMIEIEVERLRKSTRLLSKAFLKFANKLSSLDTFGELWKQILGYFIRMQHVSNGSDDIKNQEETIPETIRNILLVMEASDLLARDGKVWHLTYPILDEEYPDMVKSLFPEDEETRSEDGQTKEEVEDTEIENKPDI